MYKNTTKSAARREETSMPPMRKGAGIQQCMGHAPERCSTRGERIKTRWEAVTFVECDGYGYKSTKLEEN